MCVCVCVGGWGAGYGLRAEVSGQVGVCMHVQTWYGCAGSEVEPWSLLI